MFAIVDIIQFCYFTLGIKPTKIRTNNFHSYLFTIQNSNPSNSNTIIILHYLVFICGSLESAWFLLFDFYPKLLEGSLIP